MHLHPVLRVLFLALLIAGVAACGRKGDPRLPAGQSDAYPHGYPEGARPASEDIFRTVTTKR